MCVYGVRFEGNLGIRKKGVEREREGMGKIGAFLSLNVMADCGKRVRCLFHFWCVSFFFFSPFRECAYNNGGVDIKFSFWGLHCQEPYTWHKSTRLQHSTYKWPSAMEHN